MLKTDKDSVNVHLGPTAYLAEKQITFREIGRDLYAFTAEGDRNSGGIVGDEGVIVVDCPAGASFVAGERLARVVGLDGASRAEIRADTDGVLLSWADLAWVGAGAPIATLAVPDDDVEGS